MDAVAASKRPEQDEACIDSAGQLLCRESMRNDIESSNTLALAGDITWIAGAAVAASGATLLILSASGVFDSRQTDTIATRIVFTGNGLFALGSF